MESVIITVKSKDCDRFFDIEVPIDLQVNILINKIIETINSVDDCFATLNSQYRIYIEHLDRYLEEDETLEEAGVWEGSIMNIVKK